VIFSQLITNTDTQMQIASLKDRLVATAIWNEAEADNALAEAARNIRSPDERGYFLRRSDRLKKQAGSLYAQAARC
jgi:hypothetical protein